MRKPKLHTDLRVHHSSCLFVADPYKESLRIHRWHQLAYNARLQTRKSELYTQIDINRMRYTLYEDKYLLKSNSDFETALADLLLLSPDVKLH